MQQKGTGQNPSLPNKNEVLILSCMPKIKTNERNIVRPLSLIWIIWEIVQTGWIKGFVYLLGKSFQAEATDWPTYQMLPGQDRSDFTKSQLFSFFLSF